ncbi:MAG: prenyltransferase [Alphaproteobacteria bacterium]
MGTLHLTRGAVREGFFTGAVARILELQRDSGAIPWYDNGVIDPWNHTEAAMGLTVLGHLEAARKAYRFLAETQLEDGSWWSQYGAAVPLDDHQYTGDGESEKRIRDTNFTAYPATGIWHYFRVTGDAEFLRAYWPVIERAMDFILDHQSPEGDIRWAACDPHTPEDDALITGCSSIYKSMECALNIAGEMGAERPDWAEARARLGHALRHKPHRFDRDWESKARYSMDWYYPVLSGVLTGEAARAQLASKWETFVAESYGCRCVSDEPWVTVAESCELALALLANGQKEMAREIFSWQHRWRDEAGAYWMGYQYRDQTPWPVEKPAWTAAAVILAADALLQISPAHDLFIRSGIGSEERAAGRRRVR